MWLNLGWGRGTWYLVNILVIKSVYTIHRISENDLLTRPKFRRGVCGGGSVKSPMSTLWFLSRTDLLRRFRSIVVNLEEKTLVLIVKFLRSGWKMFPVTRRQEIIVSCESSSIFSVCRFVGQSFILGWVFHAYPYIWIRTHGTGYLRVFLVKIANNYFWMPILCARADMDFSQRADGTSDQWWKHSCLWLEIFCYFITMITLIKFSGPLIIDIQFQPSGVGGTRSPPATLHHLQNSKWPPGGPKMANRVWKGVYP